ncbi:MAG TPA: hypothetical protein VNO33_07925 [Kofleriaceae bacterium]|nr:hypothetical protein [Kofleriaceae bacterium]
MYRSRGMLLGLALGVAGCGGSGAQSGPPEAVGPQRQPDPPARAAGSAQPGDRQVLIGEMCPTAGAGRPAVRPLFVRREGWSDRPAELAAPVERRWARQFSVLDWNGKRAGLFSVAGAAEAGGVVAIGGYAGRSPCEKPRGTGARARDQDCAAALRDCGVAVAVLEPAGGFEARPVEEDPEPAELQIGGACVADGKLLVDMDRDGSFDAYPVSGFAGAVEEVAAVAAGNATCTARFAIRAAASGMDVLGVADLDGDARPEIVIQLLQGGRRTWALYSAPGTAARLERVGLGAAWPAR